MLDGTADLGYAVRRLSKAPGFTLAAVAVLACGIGANVTIFTALEAAILRGLPYPEASRLVLPAVSVPRPGEPGARRESWSYPRFRFYRRYPGLLVQPVAAYALGRPTLVGEANPVRLDAEIVSPEYFALLGASAALGRIFTPEEDDTGAPPDAAILGHGLWQSRFGGEASVLGRRISLNGSSLAVVGVMPPGFKGVTGRGELWVPMAASGVLFGQWRVDDPDVYWLHVLGRIPADVPRARAEAQMSGIADRIEEVFFDPEASRDSRGVLRPLSSAVVNRTARLSIQILAAAAGLVLLAACANLAGLLLTRAQAGQRETAVRMAIGAGRWQIVRQALAESLLLALGGGVAGVALARWGIDGLAALAPEALTRGSARLQYLDLGSLGLDTDALLFALGLSAATALLFGLAPAWKLSRASPAESLRYATGVTGVGLGRRLVLGRCLVGAQVAVALVLLVGAGLMIRSLIRLHHVETGIDAPQSLLTFTYSAPHPGSAASPYLGADDDDRVDPTAFSARVLQRIRSLPGVRDATLGCPPLGGICAQTTVRQIGDGPPVPREERTVVAVDAVEERFFQTVGGRILTGRSFASSDGPGAPPVVILNESAARALFPGESPLGRRMAFPLGPSPEGESAEIIGVVRDILYEGPETAPQPAVYSPFRQVPQSETSVIVRAAGDPLALLPAIRQELRALDPGRPIYRVSTIEALALRATGTRRMIMWLLALFAGAVLALAAVGVYGSVAHAVSRRRREIGVRMALGARSRQVVSLVLGQGLTVAAAGVVAGLAAALVVTRVVRSFLFGVTARDPATHAVGAVVLLGVALLASYLPARSASRVDPVAVLKTD